MNVLRLSWHIMQYIHYLLHNHTESWLNPLSILVNGGECICCISSLIDDMLFFTFWLTIDGGMFGTQQWRLSSKRWKWFNQTYKSDRAYFIIKHNKCFCVRNQTLGSAGWWYPNIRLKHYKTLQKRAYSWDYNGIFLINQRDKKM